MKRNLFEEPDVSAPEQLYSCETEVLLMEASVGAELLPGSRNHASLGCVAVGWSSWLWESCKSNVRMGWKEQRGQAEVFTAGSGYC